MKSMQDAGRVQFTEGDEIVAVILRLGVSK